MCTLVEGSAWVTDGEQGDARMMEVKCEWGKSGCSNGEKDEDRKVEKVSAMQNRICQRTQDYGQRSLLSIRETQLFSRLASERAEKTDLTKMEN